MTLVTLIPFLVCVFQVEEKNKSRPEVATSLRGFFFSALVLPPPASSCCAPSPYTTFSSMDAILQPLTDPSVSSCLLSAGTRWCRCFLLASEMEKTGAVKCKTCLGYILVLDGISEATTGVFCIPLSCPCPIIALKLHAWWAASCWKESR
jgi:hypothetical protein